MTSAELQGEPTDYPLDTKAVAAVVVGNALELYDFHKGRVRSNMLMQLR